MRIRSHLIAIIIASVIFHIEILFSQWVSTSFPTNVDVQILYVSGKYFFAGATPGSVFRSTDNGASWMCVGALGDIITAFAAKGTNLFIGTQGRGGGCIYLSSDNGDHWTNISAGQVYDVSAIVSDSVNIYALAYNGLYCSADNGSNWRKLAPVPMPNTSGLPNTLIINRDIFYVGTNLGIFYSPDTCNHWMHSNIGLMDTDVSTLVVCADNILVGTSTGVYVSSDFGIQWHQSITGLADRRIHCFATSGNNIYVGTDHGVFVSTNNGRQWAAINDGLPSQNLINTLVSNDTFLIAGTRRGVWRRVLSDIKPPNQCDSLVDIFPLSLGDTWTYNYSLSSYDYTAGRYSANGTVSFRIIGKPFSSDSIVWTVQKVDNLNCILNGVSYRDTAINTFTLTENELENGNYRIYSSGFPFYPMPFDAISFNRYTYVDTSGLWNIEVNKGRMKYTYTFKRDMGAISYSAMDMCTCEDFWYESYSLITGNITGIKAYNGINHLKQLRLYQNYPNPFNPSTIISFYLPSQSFVTLKVFDIKGKEISTLINRVLPAGDYTQQWNTVNVSSGVYFYRLQSDSFIETKKLVLLR